MLYLGYGVLGGCGLGLGFNTPITRTPGASPRSPLGCCEAIPVRAVYHEFADRRTHAHWSGNAFCLVFRQPELEAPPARQ